MGCVMTGGWLGRRIASLPPVLALLTAATAAPPPLVDVIRQHHHRDVRITGIARRILAANLSACPLQNTDYGLTEVTIDPTASAPVREAWLAAYGVGEQSTVITVLPGSPAAAAGIAEGDVVSAVNGEAWSSPGASSGASSGAGDDHAAFHTAMQAALAAPHMQLTLRRGLEPERIVTLEGQTVCTATIIMVNDRAVNATADGTQIAIDTEMDALLPDDDALAYVIAHEAAHIFLGHVTAEHAPTMRNAAIRGEAERAADMLGLQLMARAGFAPEAAAPASLLLARANRGAIARLFNLHGPYMAPQERAAMLEAEAARLRAAGVSPPR